MIGPGVRRGPADHARSIRAVPDRPGRLVRARERGVRIRERVRPGRGSSAGGPANAASGPGG